MSDEAKGDVAAFLTGGYVAMTIYSYSIIARAAFADPDSPTMLAFIAITGGIAGVAIYRQRKARGG